MSLWWLQPGWTDACCASCGAKIAPEGDPDWGYCCSCFSQMQEQRQAEQRAEEAHIREMELAEQYYRQHPHG